jgi:hypothetical protein
MADVSGLDELRAMPPGVERVHAIERWIERQDQLIKDARRLREADVQALCVELGGPRAASRELGMAYGTVKAIRAKA